ncbi:MAG: hypothetical protein ACRDHZ_00035 [Ktedonobacteraceae bacterium]
MSQEQPTERKGFVSPLQKAQAGKIGGGATRTQETERDVQPTISTPTPAPEQATAKKADRKETHFQQTVWMPKPLNRRLKVHAAQTGEDVSSIINTLVEKYLDEMEG